MKVRGQNKAVKLFSYCRLLVGILFLIITKAYTQHPETYLQPKDMKSDLVWLQRKILLYHPACRDSLRYDSVNAAFEVAFYEAEKPMQELPFLRLLRQTLFSLRCGHSTAIPSRTFFRYYEKARPRPFFPLQISSEPGKMSVRFNGSDDPKIKPGDQITFINQEAAEDLQSEMLSILPSDGYHNSFRHYHLSLNFPSYYLFLRGPYYYFETSLEDTSGKKRTSTLSLRSQTRVISRAKPSRSTQVLLSDGKDRDFSLLKSRPSLACLRISRFKGKPGWYRKVFNRLQRSQVKTLILDLRGNSGGNLFEANVLLSYLMPDTFSMKFIRRTGRIHFNGHSNLGLRSLLSMLRFRWLPSQRKGMGATARRNGEIIETRYRYRPEKECPFRGKLIVLMDGGTFSSASYVCAKLKKAGRASLAGQESGGAARGFNSVLTPTLTLPETRLRITMPLYFLDQEFNDPFFRGLQPDFPIASSNPALRLSGIDPELEYLSRMAALDFRPK
jgi:hypothetical protein